MTTSDSPVIYDISPEGITLPDGYSFHAHGHINYKVVTLDGTYLRTENMHFDPNNGHPGGAYIGQTFFPFNLAEGECVSWVQLGHNKIELNNPHFGEGGQEPVCKEPQPEPPILNDPEFQWVTGESVIDCEGMTVTVVSHEEAAGWYWGNDGEQHLGSFFPTGNTQEKSIPATAEECPAPPPEEENPVIDTPEYKPDPETQTVQDVSQPEQLAVTGGGLEWAALIVGAVFVAAGLALYLKRPKR